MRRILVLALAVGGLWGQVPVENDNCPAAVVNSVTKLMNENALVGVQAAVATGGTLGCAMAMGYADRDTKRAMGPRTMMRIGSVSKTITAMAIVRLYEDGKLGLDDKAVSFVPDLLPAGGPADARWQKVTLRNLMQHSTGWDRAIGGEPIQNTTAIASALGVRAPASEIDVLRWWFQQPLHFEPGTKASYTGIEYALLAIIVERVSGMDYERFVLDKVLSPMGIESSMRVGRTLMEGRLFPNDPALLESTYYVPDAYGLKPSVFPYVTANVPAAYGEFYVENLEGSGGWVANAPALLRYVNRIVGRGGPAYFKPATVTEIMAKPTYETADATAWYGLGWQIIKFSNGLGLRFAGGLRGTASEVDLLPNNNSYAFITNTSKVGGDDLTSIIFNELNAKVAPVGVGGADLFKTAKYAEAAKNLPQIRNQKGVVQGASFERGVTAGSWMSIFGWNLSTTTRLWSGPDFVGNRLPTSLDGVEVKINGKSAAVYYISPGQINAQVPAITEPGTATLQVIRDGIASNPEPIEIRANSPEVFRYFAGGKAYVAAIHANGVVVADPAVVSSGTAAKAGETVQVFGTGFGVAPDGVIVSTAIPVDKTTVTMGGRDAGVQFSGLVGAGLFQVNVVVPATLAAGDYPVAVTVNGVKALVPGLLPVR